MNPHPIISTYEYMSSPSIWDAYLDRHYPALAHKEKIKNSKNFFGLIANKKRKRVNPLRKRGPHA